MGKYISKLDDMLKTLEQIGDDMIYEAGEVANDWNEDDDREDASNRLEDCTEEFRRLLIDFKDEFEYCKKLLKDQDKIIW